MIPRLRQLLDRDVRCPICRLGGRFWGDGDDLVHHIYGMHIWHKGRLLLHYLRIKPIDCLCEHEKNRHTDEGCLDCPDYCTEYEEAK